MEDEDGEWASKAGRETGFEACFDVFGDVPRLDDVDDDASSLSSSLPNALKRAIVVGGVEDGLPQKSFRNRAFVDAHVEFSHGHRRHKQRDAEHNFLLLPPTTIDHFPVPQTFNR